ncbi:helix-turn-helix domain-containing protein [Haloplanus sp. C73]|uniref:helix-turn-helix domain-containing protein n=1 Tax=Haloplanus sp. C73 TaxID=3421641 RepID=UPI003EB99DA7
MADSDPPEPSEFDKYIQEHGFNLTTGSYNHEEMDPPDWITDLDREICGLLRHGLILTPSVLAKNLDRPRSSISRRLNTLEAGNIVEKVERGHYKMTEEGLARMLQTINTDKIGKGSPDSRTWRTTKILTAKEAEKLEDN